LIDRKEGSELSVEPQFDSPEVDNEVILDCKKDYSGLGDFVNALVTSATEFDLLADPALKRNIFLTLS